MKVPYGKKRYVHSGFFWQKAWGITICIILYKSFSFFNLWVTSSIEVFSDAYTFLQGKIKGFIL